MADYVSNYSGDQIDEAVSRALPGGALDTGKAPAGFGLGSASTDKVITSKAEMDAIRVNGWCYYNGAESLVAEANVQRATIRTDTSGRTVTQTAYPFMAALYQNCTLQRTLVDAIASNQTKEWGAWEWVNPPMILGWEYRTTERYQGKPVYVQMRESGSLAIGTSSSPANTHIEGFSGRVETVVRDELYIVPINNVGYQYKNILVDDSGKILCWTRTSLPAQTNPENAWAFCTYRCFADMSAYKGRACIWYTKNTD